MRLSPLLVCGALCTGISACSSPSSSGAPPPNGTDAATDGGADAPFEAAPDATDGGCTSPYAQGPGASAPEWCAVDAVLDRSLDPEAGAGLPGYAFQVVTVDPATGEPVLRYSRATGTVASAPADVTTPTLTASAAKMMTALLIARAAQYAKDAGSSALSPSTTVDVLGCTGLPAGVAGMKLDDLMHQTAGLTAKTENACVTKVTALHTCACDILQNDYVAAQAGTFSYTPHNFVVAAAITDTLLQALPSPTTFRALFKTWLGETGVATSEAALPITNDFAGGDHISAHAYSTLLSLALPGPTRGELHGTQLLDPVILDRMTAPWADGVAVTYSPYVEAANLDMRYGFGDWVQCSAAWPEPAAWPAVDAPAFTLDYAACPYRAVNSLGKFGYMPWFIDRDTRPYAAVLAVDLATLTGRVSVLSFTAYEMLDPVVRAAIDAGP